MNLGRFDVTLARDFMPRRKLPHQLHAGQKIQILTHCGWLKPKARAGSAGFQF